MSDVLIRESPMERWASVKVQDEAAIGRTGRDISSMSTRQQQEAQGPNMI